MRYQGRFISTDEADKLDKSLIYDPNTRLLSKPIFHTFKDTTRWHKRCEINRFVKNSMGGLESTNELNYNILSNQNFKLNINNQQSDKNDSMEIDVATSNQLEL